MVATRSQYHGRTQEALSGENQAGESEELQRTDGKRRRISNGAKSAIKHDSAQRRPTSSLGETSNASLRGREISESHSQTQRPLYSLGSPAKNDHRPPNDGIEVRIVTDARIPFQTPGVDEADKSIDTSARQDDELNADPHSSESKSAKSTEQITKTANDRCDEEHLSEMAKPMSEDHDFTNSVSQVACEPADDQFESDDEAPEVVTASLAHDQAKQAKNEAARAIQQQKAEKKRKRRAQDIRLKEQIMAAKRSQCQELHDAHELDDLTSADTLIGNKQQPFRQDGRSSTSQRAALPLLLPQELLNAEPAVTPLTLQPEKPKAKPDISRKRKRLTMDSKPPKDLQKGRFKIRVLPTASDNLPPKPSKESKSLRESWLTGQRGKRGIERRKPGGSFVRQR